MDLKKENGLCWYCEKAKIETIYTNNDDNDRRFVCMKCYHEIMAWDIEQENNRPSIFSDDYIY